MGFLIGIDEVGRGCWAGPLLVVAARPKASLPPGLKDSKLLSRKQRQQILNKLSICCDFGEGWVTAAEIDRLGLAAGLRRGISRSLRAVGAAAEDYVVLDGKVNYLPKKFTNGRCLVDADSRVPAVSAASIYAKVKRDQFMAKLALRYPGYGFEGHVGYGTKDHMLALKKLGAIKYVHRYSYAPIASLSTE